MWEGKSACRSAVDVSESCQRPSGRHESLGNPDVILKLYPSLQFYDYMIVNERDTDQWQGWLLHELLQAQTLPVDLQRARTWHVHHKVYEQCELYVCVCVLWPVGVCRSFGGRRTHCLLIAETQIHTEEKNQRNTDVNNLLILCWLCWVVHWGCHWVIHTVVNSYSDFNLSPKLGQTRGMKLWRALWRRLKTVKEHNDLFYTSTAHFALLCSCC